MSVLIFNVEQFRLEFPAFSNESTYPTETLQAYWDAATCYMSPNDWGTLAGDCRLRGLYLLTAHLTLLSTNLNATGNAPQIMQSAGIDKVSVAVVPPPIKNQWQWWLSTTPYGAQLLALLQVKSAGGWYIGGLPERSSFRKVGGVF